MIDVKALAEQAGIEFRSWKETIRSDQVAPTDLELEKFAALVLEEAAVECDELWQEDGTAMQCRDAVRAMKPKGGKE